MNYTNLFACKKETALVDRLPYGLEYVANLEHGDHAALFYDNLVVAAEYFCAYIEEGIRRNEATCFIGPSRELYETLFEQVGIKVASLENCGYINYLPLQDPYLEDAERRTGKLQRSIQEYLRTGLKSGLKGLRIINLTTSMWDCVSVQDLLRYEQSIGTRSPSLISIVCCYDTRKLLETKPELFMKLVKTHGHCIFQGMAVPTTTLVGINDSTAIRLEVAESIVQNRP